MEYVFRGQPQGPGVNQKLLKRSTSIPACQAVPSGAPCTIAPGNRYFPYVANSKEESWDLDGTALPVTTSETVYGNDPVSNIFWGDPKTITVSTRDANGGVSQKVTENIYKTAETDNGKWILGRLTSAKVTSTTPVTNTGGGVLPGGGVPGGVAPPSAVTPAQAQAAKSTLPAILSLLLTD